jgi:hypothetical protein
MTWRPIFFVFLLATMAVAQDSPDQEATAESGTEASAEEAAEDGPSDQDFVPTKEIPADEEVTFPVNI